MVPAKAVLTIQVRDHSKSMLLGKEGRGLREKVLKTDVEDSRSSQKRDIAHSKNFCVYFLCNSMFLKMSVWLYILTMNKITRSLNIASDKNKVQ